MELIVAVDRGGGIGKDGQLLYHLPEDMKRFRRLTMGKTLLMGRDTFLSLPGQRPLPGRVNCVLSHRAPELRERFPAGADGPFFYGSVEEFLTAHTDDAVIVVGGESVYRQLLPRCLRAHVTEIDAESDADRHFFLDKNEWICVRREPFRDDNLHICADFCIYERCVSSDRSPAKTVDIDNSPQNTRNAQKSVSFPQKTE